MTRYKNHLILHLTVLIFGLTGPLGKAIEAPEEVVVFYRLIFAVAGIYFYFRLSRFSFDFSLNSFKESGYIGIIVALHWITFFGAIKASNVSVALVCFSSSTLFTALLEPLYNKRRIIPYEVILGILILIGIYLITKEPGKTIFQSHYAIGIGLSIFSAFLSSWFTVLNGLLIKKGRDAKNISFIELTVALVSVAIYLGMVNREQTLTVLNVSAMDLLFTAILGILCTSFAYIASVYVMKEISAYTVTMSVNLEPIYSIVLAVLIWPESEKMKPYFYIGGAAILCVMMLNGVFKARYNRKTANLF
jgi:drug/metabolite transporter (DMT)-like permease